MGGGEGHTQQATGHLGWVRVRSSIFVLAGPAWERPNPAPASLEGRDLATQPQQVLSTWMGQTENQQPLRQQPGSESKSTLTFEPKLPTPSLWFPVTFQPQGAGSQSGSLAQAGL